MTQASAPMSPAIKVVTGLVLVMIVALFLAAGKVGAMLLAGPALGCRLVLLSPRSHCL